jgi:hypothetical protein
MANIWDGFLVQVLVSGRPYRRHRRLRNIFCQSSGSVSPRNLSVSEMQQWMPSDLTMPFPAIRQRFPSISPHHKAFSSNEARHFLQWGHGNRL